MKDIKLTIGDQTEINNSLSNIQKEIEAHPVQNPTVLASHNRILVELDVISKVLTAASQLRCTKCKAALNTEHRFCPICGQGINQP